MELITQRRANLNAALGSLQIPPTEPELRLLHRWRDTWTGLGLVVAGRRWSRGQSSRVGWLIFALIRPTFAPWTAAASC